MTIKKLTQHGSSVANVNIAKTFTEIRTDQVGRSTVRQRIESFQVFHWELTRGKDARLANDDVRTFQFRRPIILQQSQISNYCRYDPLTENVRPESIIKIPQFLTIYRNFLDHRCHASNVWTIKWAIIRSIFVRSPVCRMRCVLWSNGTIDSRKLQLQIFCDI